MPRTPVIIPEVITKRNLFEAMPVVFIYDFKVKDKAKVELRPKWCDGLPIAKGQWGLGLEQDSAMDSHVYVRNGGGMEEELFIATVLFYVSLYKNISPTFVYDAEGNLVSGPILIKTDSGAGRQGKPD